MIRFVAAGFAIALGLTADAAQAGPCSDEIGRIETAMKQPGFQPSGTQTAAAGSDQQPTQGAVQRPRTARPTRGSTR